MHLLEHRADQAVEVPQGLDVPARHLAHRQRVRLREGVEERRVLRNVRRE